MLHISQMSVTRTLHILILITNLLSTYCLDLNGSQLGNYSSIDVQSFL